MTLIEGQTPNLRTLRSRTLHMSRSLTDEPRCYRIPDMTPGLGLRKLSIALLNPSDIPNGT
jgi:hypothetical protein